MPYEVPPLPYAYDGRRAWGMEAGGEDPGAGSLEILAQDCEVPHDWLQDLGWRGITSGLVDAQ